MTAIPFNPPAAAQDLEAAGIKRRQAEPVEGLVSRELAIRSRQFPPSPKTPIGSSRPDAQAAEKAAKSRQPARARGVSGNR